MNYEILFTFLVLATAVTLFVTEKLRVDLVALLVMALLLVSGILSPSEGLAGFSNTATITVASMFVLSAGLTKTGAVDLLGTAVTVIFKTNFWIAILLVMGLAGFLSAFINNTPVIAIFLPILLEAAKHSGLSPSKILMPVSFASIFGGVCTLIGTSTNILVSSIAEKRGIRPFTMFEFAPMGIIMFAVGTVYLLLIGIRLIPERTVTEELAERYDLGDYLTEIVIDERADSAGRTIKDAPIVHEVGLLILKIHRDGEDLFNPGPDTRILAGDILLVQCDLEKIRKMQQRDGVTLKPQAKWGDEILTSEDYLLVEGVVAPNSLLIGQTLKGADFRANYAATVLALRHRGKILREKLSETPLGAGDMLLIEVQRDKLPGFRKRGDVIITSAHAAVTPQRGRALAATAIMIGVVAVAGSNVLPVVTAAVAGAVLLILMKCITLEEAYRAIEWKIVFLLAGVLSLGVALDNTGAARIISSQMVESIGPLGPIALISAFYLITSITTEVMSNNAAAALLAPIAITTALSLGLSPQPFLVAVAFAASASFMTPVGYQTNAMIYGPGGYTFGDFAKVGTPLNIIFWIMASLLIPIFWPL